MYTLVWRVALPQISLQAQESVWTTLRANLSFQSAAFRHALRLGFTLMLITALYSLLSLPIQRGYWIALTALLVLKPDFTTTFTRGVARLLGTMLGAILTTLLIVVVHPTPPILVILDVVMAYAAFSLLLANYALFSVFVTMEVVFLLSFVIPQPLVTVEYRAIDTAIGGIIALVIYRIWPTWERRYVANNLAQRLDVLRRYFVTVMSAYVNPSSYDDALLHKLQREARLSRSNTNASIQRSLQEPRAHRIDAEMAQGILNASDTLAQSFVALQAYLIENPTHYAFPECALFANQVDETLLKLATALRTSQPVGVLPDLRATLNALKSPHAPEAKAVRAEQSVVYAEARRIVDAVNVIAQLLVTHLGHALDIWF